MTSLRDRRASTSAVAISESDSDRRPEVAPERLLTSRSTSWATSRSMERMGRWAIRSLMNRMDRHRLVVEERSPVDGTATTTTFGPGGGLVATIRVLDQRAWPAILTEGSIGLGRGYLEGWWDSDDPTTVVRIIIHNIERLDEIRNGLAQRVGWVGDAVRHVRPRAGRSRNREDISSHYDLGNEFFGTFLDDTMSYSSAIFPSAEVALAEASVHKYDLLIDKLGIAESQRVLEIGTGWGGFALRAVDVTGCQVTTTTISSNQLREARLRVRRAGFIDDITLLDSDWRDLQGTFDRVVSIEMIEAVDWRDYGRYFDTIERCLEPGGLVGIQAICVPDRRYERTKNTEDFIRRFVFPGGFLPSIGAIGRAVTRSTQLQIIGVEDFSAHYAETLRRWRTRFDERIDDVKALGLDERFCRLWRFYLAYCEAAFLERHCTVNQIILAGREWRPDPLA